VSGYCTLASAFSSCFAGNPLPGPTLDAVRNTMEDRDLFTDTQHFFLQFLQITPDAGYIALNLGGSLLDMALESNPYIGPFVFSWIAPSRPENVTSINTPDL
jgi:hypothetical protein